MEENSTAESEVAKAEEVATLLRITECMREMLARSIDDASEE